MFADFYFVKFTNAFVSISPPTLSPLLFIEPTKITDLLLVLLLLLYTLPVDTMAFHYFPLSLEIKPSTKDGMRVTRSYHTTPAQTVANLISGVSAQLTPQCILFPKVPVKKTYNKGRVLCKFLFLAHFLPSSTVKLLRGLCVEHVDKPRTIQLKSLSRNLFLTYPHPPSYRERN